MHMCVSNNFDKSEIVYCNISVSITLFYNNSSLVIRKEKLPFEFSIQKLIANWSIKTDIQDSTY